MPTKALVVKILEMDKLWVNKNKLEVRWHLSKSNNFSKDSRLETRMEQRLTEVTKVKDNSILMLTKIATNHLQRVISRALIMISKIINWIIMPSKILSKNEQILVDLNTRGLWAHWRRALFSPLWDSPSTQRIINQAPTFPTAAWNRGTLIHKTVIIHTVCMLKHKIKWEATRRYRSRLASPRQSKHDYPRTMFLLMHRTIKTVW